MVAFGGMTKVADTGRNGFTLQNATPNIFQWTAPNDGQNHRFSLLGEKNVSSAETGGQINCSFTLPDGTPVTITALGGTLGAGQAMVNYRQEIIAPGTTITLLQSTALTAGASVLWAELWAS